MDSLQVFIDKIGLSPAGAQSLKEFLAHTDQGFDLSVPPDSGFYALTDEDLQRAGLNLHDRRLLMSHFHAQTGREYFIEPVVQTRVAAATFIIEDDDQPQGIGMGIFFTARRAVTANHNFPEDWPINTYVKISFPETSQQAIVKIVKRDREYDYALLETETDRPFVPVSTHEAGSYKGRELVLASFCIGIAEYAPMFGRRLGFVTAVGITPSLHGHHLFYACPTFSGDSGAALLLKEGRLIGLHVEVVNALRERLGRKKDVEDRLAEVEESLDAVVSGGLGQGCVAVLAGVFAQ